MTSRNCEIAKLSDTLPPTFLSSLSRPIEVCVGKGNKWTDDMEAFLGDMTGTYWHSSSQYIRYVITDKYDTSILGQNGYISLYPGMTNNNPWYLDQQSPVRPIRIGIDAKSGSSSGHLFNVYLVRPVPSDSGPVFISDEKPPKWYTIKAQNSTDAWDYITTTPTTSKRFYTFLGNSTKYINSCCSSPDTPPFLSTVCANTYSMYNKEPLSGLPSPQCDRRMRELCAIKSEANDPICACINRPDPSMMGQTLSEYTTKTLKLPDKCTSGTCNVKLSYVPTSLRRQICPNICSSIVEVDSDGYSTVEMDDIHVGVECNKKSGDPSLSSMVSTTMSGNGGTKYRDQWVLYVLVAIIVILVILLIFLYTSYKFRDE